MPRAAALRRPKPELQLKKLPRQARAQATFDAIVEACGRQMIERGYGALTTNHVAEAAGVGIASLYEYFPGKDAIVAVVAERLVSRVLARLTAAVPEILAAPPDAAAHRWIDRIYQVLDGERRLVAAFVYEVPYTNRLPAIRAVAPRLLELSRAVRRLAGPRLKIAREAATLHLMINLVSSTVLQLVLDPPADVAKDELLAALAERIDRWARGD